MGRIVKGCVREVQVCCILMYVYVAPSTPVGAWSMARGYGSAFSIIVLHGSKGCITRSPRALTSYHSNTVMRPALPCIKLICSLETIALP